MDGGIKSNVPNEASQPQPTQSSKSKSVVGIGLTLAGVATAVAGIGLGILLSATALAPIVIGAIVVSTMVAGGAVSLIGISILLKKSPPQQQHKAPDDSPAQQQSSTRSTTSSPVIGNNVSVEEPPLSLEKRRSIIRDSQINGDLQEEVPILPNEKAGPASFRRDAHLEELPSARMERELSVPSFGGRSLSSDDFVVAGRGDKARGVGETGTAVSRPHNKPAESSPVEAESEARVVSLPKASEEEESVPVEKPSSRRRPSSDPNSWKGKQKEFSSTINNISNQVAAAPKKQGKGREADFQNHSHQIVTNLQSFVSGKNGLIQTDLQHNSDTNITETIEVVSQSGAKATVPAQFQRDVERNSLNDNVTIHSTRGPTTLPPVPIPPDDVEWTEADRAAAVFDTHQNISTIIGPKESEADWVQRLELEMSQGSQAVSSLLSNSVNQISAVMGDDGSGNYYGVARDSKQTFSVEKDSAGNISQVKITMKSDLTYTKGRKGEDEIQTPIGGGAVINESYVLKKNDQGEFVIQGYQSHIVEKQPYDPKKSYDYRLPPADSVSTSSNLTQAEAVRDFNQNLEGIQAPHHKPEEREAVFRAQIHKCCTEEVSSFFAMNDIKSLNAEELRQNSDKHAVNLVGFDGKKRAQEDKKSDLVPTEFRKDMSRTSTKTITLSSGKKKPVSLTKQGQKPKEGEVGRIHQDVRKALGLNTAGLSGNSSEEDWAHRIEQEMSQSAEAGLGTTLQFGLGITQGMPMGVDSSGNYLGLARGSCRLDIKVEKDSSGKIVKVQFQLVTEIGYGKGKNPTNTDQWIGGGLKVGESYELTKDADGKFVMGNYDCKVREMPADWKPKPVVKN